ncbi:hypothetical protein VDGE_00302 [Verticillium dahliae]|uniref:SET domain-containing protein n=1 Tax=Verticillium dahliae TaxID=27337 RepID=A0A444RX64_VERDA|nr:hypothetical protein VDGE_00302 [Verticillium dahliae]
MPDPHLDITASLPAWNRLNNVDLIDVIPKEIPQSGFGFVAARALSRAEEALDSPALARIPRGLVLSKEAVDDHAKVDGHFRVLLDAVGRKSTRGDACLFLLVQKVLASHPQSGLVSTPWTEYVKFLPREVPVPTMWSEQERELLQGTSLELAVGAKIQALTSEFEALREKSSDLPFWHAIFWDTNNVSLADWFLVDAWYRSRSLELPSAGVSMVPVLDLANHAPAPSAYYEESARREGDVELLLRPGSTLAAGDEVTISYGAGKSGAEMLFSYGFIDPARSTDTVALPLAPLEDDPLGKAKVHSFGGPRTVELTRTSGGAVAWTSPFAWLACLNEEDGLAFAILQDVGGGRDLGVFWQDSDVTARADDWETLVRDHPQYNIFRLRVVAVLEARVASQLERMQTIEGDPRDAPPGQSHSIHTGCLDAATTLREQEASVLQAAARALEAERGELLADDSVLAYLGSMEISQNEQVEETASNDSDDFS